MLGIWSHRSCGSVSIIYVHPNQNKLGRKNIDVNISNQMCCRKINRLILIFNFIYFIFYQAERPSQQIIIQSKHVFSRHRASSVDSAVTTSG